MSTKVYKIKTCSLIMLLFVSVLFSLFACNKELPDSPGELVLYNGEIYTVNTNQPWAEAMYIKNGVIQHIGTIEETENKAPKNTTFVDLKGSFVMPGIHDVHMHPLEAASDNFQFIVNENEINPENYAYEVEQAINSNPGTGWLLGWGHYLETVLDATRPPKEILDDVAPDRPVAIMEQTSHSVWCNTKALNLFGIVASTPNPPGGIIMRGMNNEPNGILIDNAGNQLLEFALQPTTTRAQNDYNGLINYALPELAKYGITSVCDARTYWKRNHQETWKRIESEGKLTARVNLGLWLYPDEDDETQLGILQSLYSNDENSLLKINQIKLYSDGIVHNTTAAMHDAYLIDYFSLSTNNGLNYVSQQRISQYISILEPTGFDFHIHALGNRAVHESLNAIEQSATSNGRHRLTHVEFVDPSDYSRFGHLNVTADAQVAGDFTNPTHWHDNDYLTGADLADNIIPLKSLKNAGARITLSSDWDVSTLNPFIGMANAVSRAPQELQLDEIVKAYTINAAYVMRQEDKVGSLEEGKEADFIILDRNIFDIPQNQIGQTKVLETYLKGQLIYQR